MSISHDHYLLVFSKVPIVEDEPFFVTILVEHGISKIVIVHNYVNSIKDSRVILGEDATQKGLTTTCSKLDEHVWLFGLDLNDAFDKLSLPQVNFTIVYLRVQ